MATSLKCKFLRKMLLYPMLLESLYRRKTRFLRKARPRIGIYVASFNSSAILDAHLHCIFSRTVCGFDYYIMKNVTIRGESEAFDQILRRYPFARVYEGVSGACNCALRHGESLQKMVANTDNEIIVIMDVDAFVLADGWDRFIIEKLAQHAMIGVLAHFEGRNTGGSIPLVVHPSFMAFKRDFLEENGLDLLEGEGNDPAYKLSKFLLSRGEFNRAHVFPLTPSAAEFPNGFFANHPDFGIDGGVSHGFCTSYGDLLFHFWHSMNFAQKKDIYGIDGQMLVGHALVEQRMDYWICRLTGASANV